MSALKRFRVAFVRIRGGGGAFGIFRKYPLALGHSFSQAFFHFRLCRHRLKPWRNREGVFRSRAVVAFTSCSSRSRCPPSSMPAFKFPTCLATLWPAARPAAVMVLAPKERSVRLSCLPLVSSPRILLRIRLDHTTTSTRFCFFEGGVEQGV